MTASGLQGVVCCIRGADLAQLNNLIARLDHGRSDLVSTCAEQYIAMYCRFELPQPADENFDIGKSYSQPFAEVTCLGQSAGR